jgi:manganese transport protein
MEKENTLNKSMEEVHESVNTTNVKGRWKRYLAFAGPAYMISVGYMDPGNWATDIEGGSRFGYSLLWILVLSNVTALLLQSLCARLGLVTGLDLAQASRSYYPKSVNIVLYILAEISIAACDLAEVIGMAIGLQLLFKIPLLYGILITTLDTFLLLFLLNYGIKKLEAFIIALVALIGLSFLVQLIIAQPSMIEIAGGLIPQFTNTDALYIATGIIGATVMPHNLYLHSSLVQTRKIQRTNIHLSQAIKYNIADSAVALNLALFVNAAILILAASTFYKNGFTEVKQIQDAHQMLTPLLGSTLAPILFAVALILAGQSSTITGTMAGQIIMEGYLNLRFQPWIRRIITRCIAIIPAVITVIYFGTSQTGALLVLSQVILSVQLGFAVIPLIHIVSDRRYMKDFTISLKTKLAAWTATSLILALNIKMIYDQSLSLYFDNDRSLTLKIVVALVEIILIVVLFYITIKPFITKNNIYKGYQAHGDVKALEVKSLGTPKYIGIAVDYSEKDSNAVSKGLQMGGKEAKYLLIHVSDTPNAMLYGNQTTDSESMSDKNNLVKYAAQLINDGYTVDFKLGYGKPSTVISEIVNSENIELLIMGAHGHKGLQDILFGTTIEDVRHRVKIPVLIT